MVKKKVIDLRAAGDVPAGDVNITYNGVRIAGFSEDTDATLKTGMKRVEHDIGIEYTKPQSAPIVFNRGKFVNDISAEMSMNVDTLEYDAATGKIITNATSIRFQERADINITFNKYGVSNHYEYLQIIVINGKDLTFDVNASYGSATIKHQAIVGNHKSILVLVGSSTVDQSHPDAFIVSVSVHQG